MRLRTSIWVLLTVLAVHWSAETTAQRRAGGVPRRAAGSPRQGTSPRPIPSGRLNDARERLEGAPKRTLRTPEERRPTAAVVNFGEPPVSLQAENALRPPSNWPSAVLGRTFNTFLTPPAKPLRTSQVSTAQQVLKARGLYDGTPDGIAGPLTFKAVSAFELATGRTATGQLNERIFDELLFAAVDVYDGIGAKAQQEVDGRIGDFLADAGFGLPSEPFVERLRRYQEFHGLATTGRVDPRLSQVIAADRTLITDTTVAEISERAGIPPELTLANLQSAFFASASDGKQRYLLAHPDAPELWFIDAQSGTVVDRRRSGAFEAFHALQRETAAANSSDEVMLLHASPHSVDPTSPIRLQIGSKAVSIARGEYDAFVRGEGALEALRFLDSSGADAKPRRLGILASGLFGDSRYGGYSATEQAAALKALLGDRVDVFVARDPVAARRNLVKRDAAIVKAADDIAVYTSETVVDHGILDNLARPLARAGIRVVTAAEQERTRPTADDRVGQPRGGAAPASNVIVITGHRDVSMDSHLTRLKDAGWLAGKFVVIISCYERGVEVTQSSLLAGPLAASGVLFFSEAVNAPAVELVIRKLADRIGAGELGDKLEQLLKRSVEDAADEAITPIERLEIRKLHRAIWQLSRTVPESPAVEEVAGV